MKKKRLIPVLLLRNGFLVQSKSFSRYQNVGNPVTVVKRLSEWAADELIYIDISRDDVYDMRRDDLGHHNRNSIVEIIGDVADVCYMPIAMGGKIRNIDDIHVRLNHGADKVTINTAALDDPEFVTLAAKEFGSQCIVVSVDVKLIDGKYQVMRDGGRQQTGRHPIDWAKELESRGAGEVLLNSIDRDGTRLGYDIELLASVAETVKLPVIALGGVGEWEHLEEALQKTNVDAVAVANVFHFVDQSVYLAKKHLYDRGYNVRPPDLIVAKENRNEIL